MNISCISELIFHGNHFYNEGQIIIDFILKNRGRQVNLCPFLGEVNKILSKIDQIKFLFKKSNIICE